MKEYCSYCEYEATQYAKDWDTGSLIPLCDGCQVVFAAGMEHYDAVFFPACELEDYQDPIDALEEERLDHADHIYHIRKDEGRL